MFPAKPPPPVMPKCERWAASNAASPARLQDDEIIAGLGGASRAMRRARFDPAALLSQALLPRC